MIVNGELLDERSTNGTFVNGRQVPYCLEQVRRGLTCFIFNRF